MVTGPVGFQFANTTIGSYFPLYGSHYRGTLFYDTCASFLGERLYASRFSAKYPSRPTIFRRDYPGTTRGLSVGVRQPLPSRATSKVSYLYLFTPPRRYSRWSRKEARFSKVALQCRNTIHVTTIRVGVLAFPPNFYARVFRSLFRRVCVASSQTSPRCANPNTWRYYYRGQGYHVF